MLTWEPALPEDLDSLFRLNKHLIDTYEDLTTIDYDKVLHWVRRNIESNLASFRRVLWDGQLAGYYSLTPAEGKMELDSLFVLPGFQRKGIGTSIITQCLRSCPCVYLYVFRKNRDAIRLYQRLGFQITKEVGHTRYIMEYKNQDC